MCLKNIYFLSIELSSDIELCESEDILEDTELDLSDDFQAFDNFSYFLPSRNPKARLAKNQIITMKSHAYRPNI